MKHFIAFFIFSAFTHLLMAQDGSSATANQLKLLDSIATQDVPQGAPGIAVGIIKDGKPYFEKYAGYADMKDRLLIDGSSRFNIASNAKQFTALAILLLDAENKLHLNDDIRIFLPELYPALKSKITIENLLNHSSGIRDVYDLWSLQGITWWKKTFNNQDAIKLLAKQKELNFEPGTRHLYSNSNYIILAQIVEKVSKVSFITYTDRLFKKLGMPNTSFVDDHRNILGPIASPYFNFDKWEGYRWLCDIHGDGNLFSTLPDLLNWEKIVQASQCDSLPAGLIMKSQQTIANSAITEYGYGLEFGEYKGISYRFHEGSTGAWKATVVRFPQERLSIVTLTNSGKTIPAMQTRQMADEILGSKTKTVKHLIQPEHIGDLVTEKEIIGTYQDENDFTFRFELRDTALFLLRTGRNDIKLVRESANIFHQWNDPPFKQEFKKNAKGTMQVTAYYTTHAPYTLDKAESNLEGFDFRAWDGVYKNDETNTFISLKYLTDKKYQVKLGKDKMDAFLISPLKMLCDGYTIQFAKDGSPIILLNSNRIKNVSYKLNRKL